MLAFGEKFLQAWRGGREDWAVGEERSIVVQGTFVGLGGGVGLPLGISISNALFGWAGVEFFFFVRFDDGLVE